MTTAEMKQNEQTYTCPRINRNTSHELVDGCASGSACELDKIEGTALRGYCSYKP